MAACSITSRTRRSTRAILFSATVPKLDMNDFGVFVGGPVHIPGVYRGRDKTFFFASYEGLRLAKESVLLQSVPSAALRAGDLSAYKSFKDPDNGGPFPNNQIHTESVFADIAEGPRPLLSTGQHRGARRDRQQLRVQLRDAHQQQSGATCGWIRTSATARRRSFALAIRSAMCSTRPPAASSRVGPLPPRSTRALRWRTIS